jgi:hypothetical protein
MSWFGLGGLSTCDVTVDEFELCWKAMVQFHGSYSCERPAAFSYDESERVGDCFSRMETKCESSGD